MEKTERTRAAILGHCRDYPRLEIQDIFKFIFQSACGCEHMVSDRERVLNYIRYEYENMTPSDPKIDALDGNYSRVHLSCIGEKLTVDALADMFLLSARKEPDTRAEIEAKIFVVRELIAAGELGFSLDEFDRAAEEWKSLGYPAIHHTDSFRAAYRPAYRVIHNDYLEKIKNGK